MVLAEFLTIAIAHLLAVASPGPDFFLVLRQSVTIGPRAGLWASTGIALGILLHVTYCLLGVALLVASSASLFLVLKLLAAIYLIYLGGRVIRDSSLSKPQDQTARDDMTGSPGGWILTGFLTNGLNPKATLFFLALFTAVIDGATPVQVQIFYGIYLSAATFCWFAMMSILLGRTSVRQFLLQAGKWFERIMGFVLIGIGVQLAFAISPL